MRRVGWSRTGEVWVGARGVVGTQVSKARPGAPGMLVRRGSGRWRGRRRGGRGRRRGGRAGWRCADWRGLESCWRAVVGFEVGVAFVGEVAGDVEAFGEGGFDVGEEGGDFVGGGGGEDAGGLEEEIAVAVGGVEAGGFEEDGVGGGLDEGVDGWREGCPMGAGGGVGMGRDFLLGPLYLIGDLDVGCAGFDAACS